MTDDSLIVKLVAPEPLLRPFVRTYWTMVGPYVPMHVQHIVPNGCAGIIFYRSGDVSFKEIGGSLATLAGPTMKTVDLSRQGRAEMIGVQFSELGFRAIFNMPVSLVADRILPLDIIDDGGLRELQDKVLNAPDLNSGIDAINAHFIGRLSCVVSDTYNLRRIAASMSVIDSSFARCNTADVADVACLSSKQLSRVFKEYVGLSPAEMIRIRRCNGLIADIRKMAKGQGSTLSDISAHYGYYDLSHMSRELKSICGASAREILSSARAEAGNYSWGLERAR